jgi:hypothetical protein
MVTGCNIVWKKESEKSTSLEAKAGVEEGGIATAEASASKENKNSKSKETEGRQAYGTTYCNFYEV